MRDDPAAQRTDHFCTKALGNAEGALVSGFAVVLRFDEQASHGGLLLWVWTVTALAAYALRCVLLG